MKNYQKIDKDSFIQNPDENLRKLPGSISPNESDASLTHSNGSLIR